MEPTLQAAHKRHVAFHDSIARHAARLEVKRYAASSRKPEHSKPALVVLPKFAGYVLDDDYHRAWSIAMLDFDPMMLRHGVRIEDIQRIVCRHYGIEFVDMLSARRTAPLIIPRHMAMYLCRRLTPKSLPEIARRFGGRDHTVTIFAVRKITGLIETDEQIQASVEMLVVKLGGDIT